MEGLTTTAEAIRCAPAWTASPCTPPGLLRPWPTPDRGPTEDLRLRLTLTLICRSALTSGHLGHLGRLLRLLFDAILVLLVALAFVPCRAARRAGRGRD